MADDSRDRIEGEWAGVTKPCVVCAHEIPAEARKCTRCGGHQNWWLRAPLGATTLSLLIALVATVSTALPTIRNAMRTEDSDIYMKFSGFDGSEITMVAVNSGTKPGFVGRGQMDVAPGDPIKLRMVGRELALLAPGQALPIQFAIDPATRLNEEAIKRVTTRDRCRGYFEVTNFKSDTAHAEFAYACYLLQEHFLEAKGRLRPVGR